MGGVFSRTTKSSDKLLYDLFGSLLLLQAMCDLQPAEKGNPPDADVNSILSKLTKQLPPAPDEDLEAWRAALDVVNMALVPLLQKSDTTPSLQSFLPEQGQSWKHFFETKLKVSETDLAHLISFVGVCVKSEVQGEFKFLVLELFNARKPERIAQEAKRYVPCAVACAWSNKNNNRLADDLRPRFYLLRALCDQLPIFTSTSEASAQQKMSREISICFALLLDAAESPDRLSEVVDRFLVPYLQLQPELAKSLRDYLPKSRQSWIDFLHIRLNGAEKDGSKPNVQRKLLDACKSLVGQFRSEYLSPVVKQIHNRYTKTFSVPEAHIEVNVLYATDRLATEDGEYIGEHSADSTWRKDRVLHYGVMTVGIPHNTELHKENSDNKELLHGENSENYGTKATNMPVDDDGASTSVGIPGEGEKSRMESPESNDPLKHVEILSVDTRWQADRGKFVKDIKACIHNPLQLSVSLMVGLTNHGQYILCIIRVYRNVEKTTIFVMSKLGFCYRIVFFDMSVGQGRVGFGNSFLVFKNN